MHTLSLMIFVHSLRHMSVTRQAEDTHPSEPEVDPMPPLPTRRTIRNRNAPDRLSPTMHGKYHDTVKT